MKKFSTKEAIGFGWKTFKKNWKFLVVVALSPLFVGLLSAMLDGIAKTPFNIVWPIILWVFSMIIGIGILKIYLMFAVGVKPQLKELIINYKFFFRFLFTGILYGLIVFLGIILLIVPGVIFSIRLGFWKYTLIDKDLGIIASLKESWRITKGNTLKLFAFRIIQFLVNVLGILALGVGVLVSGSVSLLAEAFVYKKLSSKP